MTNNQAIGIFDSGIGGLTVMKEIIHKLPHENLVYFGDTARLPYGDKSPETILRYTIENSIFLMEHKIKLLVIACNTASAFAIEKLRHILRIPIIDVIASGSDHVAQISKNQKIGVLATRATTTSRAYNREIQKRLPNAEIFSIACPLLVPLIEEHFFDHPATQLILNEYLAPLKKTEIDTLLLGCTHYPLIRHHIQNEIGNNVIVVDSASTCADSVAAKLMSESLLNLSKEKPSYHYFASDYPEKFKAHGIKYLGQEIKQVLVPSKIELTN